MNDVYFSLALHAKISPENMPQKSPKTTGKWGPTWAFGRHGERLQVPFRFSQPSRYKNLHLSRIYGVIIVFSLVWRKITPFHPKKISLGEKRSLCHLSLPRDTPFSTFFLYRLWHQTLGERGKNWLQLQKSVNLSAQWLKESERRIRGELKKRCRQMQIATVFLQLKSAKKNQKMAKFPPWYSAFCLPMWCNGF